MDLETTVNAEKEKFLTTLRSKTSYWHKKLESLENSKAILAADVSPTQYLHYLQLMYGFVRPFEENVFQQLSGLVHNLNERDKTALLEKDLVKLGMDIQQVYQLPMYQMAGLLTNAQALGAMYVMEGSTLGGAYIYKHINKVLGTHTESGASYFQPYGPHAGSYWKSFLDDLVLFSLNNAKQDEVIESAVATFKNIYDWFERDANAIS